MQLKSISQIDRLTHKAILIEKYVPPRCDAGGYTIAYVAGPGGLAIPLGEHTGVEKGTIIMTGPECRVAKVGLNCVYRGTPQVEIVAADTGREYMVYASEDSLLVLFEKVKIDVAA